MDPNSRNMETQTANKESNNNAAPSLNLEKLKIPKNGQTVASASETRSGNPVKKKRRDKSDLGDSFVAPDGGWGWLVTVSSGVNVLVTFAVAQQFGIIFRDHMYKLGITNSELTTIINTQIAVSALTGLLNGPLFRRFTYRQVALGGSLLVFLGIFFSVFAESFIFYMCSFSCCYGFGRGLLVSASSMAVNTYFKQKRRTATAYQFGVAGLGPIVLPYVATYMLQSIGVQGTVLLFAGLSLHTIACSLVYQPVIWHVKKVDKDAEVCNQNNGNEEEIEQFAELETPILPRANDGWFGSRSSLNTLSHRNRLGTWDKSAESGAPMQELKRLYNAEVVRGKPRSFSTSESIKEEEDDPKLRDQSEYNKSPSAGKLTMQEKTQIELEDLEAAEEAERQKLPFYKKVIIFFDLDLLRDFTYVNLALGLTLITFVEINFAILTPFILSDFGFSNNQIAMAMSLLGFCDLVIRFAIPLLTAKIPFSNKVFFIIGIIGMCIGRVFLAFTRDFYFMIGIFAWLGLFKAFRTVFCLLIIPGYVPLKRLPAAAGLQLLMSGILSFALGPIIGLIRDNTNYAFTLNFLNGVCIFAILLWVAEDLLRKNKKTTMK